MFNETGFSILIALFNWTEIKTDTLHSEGYITFDNVKLKDCVKN